MIKNRQMAIRHTQSSFAIDYGMGGIFKGCENACFLNPMGEGISSAIERGNHVVCAITIDFNDKKK